MDDIIEVGFVGLIPTHTRTPKRLKRLVTHKRADRLPSNLRGNKTSLYTAIPAVFLNGGVDAFRNLGTPQARGNDTVISGSFVLTLQSAGVLLDFLQLNDRHFAVTPGTVLFELLVEHDDSFRTFARIAKYQGKYHIFVLDDEDSVQYTATELERWVAPKMPDHRLDYYASRSFKLLDKELQAYTSIYTKMIQNPDGTGIALTAAFEVPGGSQCVMVVNEVVDGMLSTSSIFDNDPSTHITSEFPGTINNPSQLRNAVAMHLRNHRNAYSVPNDEPVKA